MLIGLSLTILYNFERISEIIANDFDDITIEQYMLMNEEDAVTTGHHSLGRVIRNEFELG
jgi:hypothetical protein